MNKTGSQYDEYVKSFIEHSRNFSDYATDRNFAVSRGSEAIFTLDEKLKRKALSVFRHIDNIHRSGMQFPIQRSYDILTTAFLFSSYGDIMETLDEGNIAVIADYFSMKEEEHIRAFLPLIASNGLINAVRINCAGTVSQSMMCEKILEHAKQQEVDVKDSEGHKTFLNREMRYVESNPLPDAASGDAMEELSHYVHDTYFSVNASRNGK